MTRRKLTLGISAGGVALVIISWSLVRSNAPEKQQPEVRSAADNAAPTPIPTVLVATVVSQQLHSQTLLPGELPRGPAGVG